MIKTVVFDLDDMLYDELGITYDDKLIDSAVKTYRQHIPKITLPQHNIQSGK